MSDSHDLQVLRLADDLTITRMGYGAMQLAGPNVFGEPRDRVEAIAGVAFRVGASAQQVALAWLLQRSSTSVVIPGTSSRVHLRENITAADLVLPADCVVELDAIGVEA